MSVSDKTAVFIGGFALAVALGIVAFAIFGQVQSVSARFDEHGALTDCTEFRLGKAATWCKERFLEQDMASKIKMGKPMGVKP